LFDYKKTGIFLKTNDNINFCHPERSRRILATRSSLQVRWHKILRLRSGWN